MDTKVCKGCLVELNTELFYTDKKSLDGFRHKCKICMNLYRKTHYATKSREVEVHKSSQWKKANRELSRSYCAKWRRGNKHTKAEHERLRKARNKKAKPPWLNAEQKKKIQWYYLVAELIRKQGIDCQVDHIVPLLGVEVCGLHVPWNMQILTTYENQTKHNKH